MKHVVVNGGRARLGHRHTRRVAAFATCRPRLAAIAAALLGTVIFAVPILQMFKPGTAHWPAFLLSGDIRMYLFPEYVAGYYRFWHGGISGLDFATDGGASVFGFRPNMPQFYPPYLLSYFVVNASRLDVAAAALSVLQLIHVFVGTYFTVRLGTRFLSLRTGGAVLLALLYVFSYTTGQYYFYFLYFFQITLVPVVAYVICDLMFRRHALAAVLVSPVFVTYFLTNYGPTMAMGLIVAVAIALGVFATRLWTRFRRRAVFRLLLPGLSLTLAGLVVLPFYIGEQSFHEMASSVPRDIDTTAFAGSFTGYDLVSAFSWLLPGATPTEGSLHWGLLPPLVIVLGLSIVAAASGQPTRSRWMLLASLGVFAAFLSICLGQASIASDIFFTLVPVLGSMHLYQRYLMFGQFFLWLPVALAAQIFIAQASPNIRRVAFITATVFWLALTMAVGLLPEVGKVANGGWFLVELWICYVGALILTFGRSSLAMAALALPMIATSLWPVFGEARAVGTPNFWKDHLGYDKVVLDKLSRTLDAGGGKALSKVLDLTPDVDSYVGRNEPWLLFSRRPVMNFLGYEPHLAMDRAYAEMMGGYGHFDRNWVLHSGVDFVIWDSGSEAALKELTADTVTAADKTPIGDGRFVSRIIFKETLSPGQFLPLLSLSNADPSAWKVATLDQWTMDGGRAVKRQNGLSGNLSVASAPTPGRRYGVSLTVLGSTRGHLTLAFGSVGDPTPVPGDKPGRYTWDVEAVEPGGLWVNGSSDFDGAVTDIDIRELPGANVENLPVVADNGVLRLESADASAKMTRFESDWTKHLSADFDTTGPARIIYELWPIAYMVPRLDGVTVDWARVGRNPAYIEVAPGHHHLEIAFRSTAASSFAVLTYIYLFIYSGVVLVVAARPFARRLRRARIGR